MRQGRVEGGGGWAISTFFLPGGGYGGDGGIWRRSTAEENLVKRKWEKMKCGIRDLQEIALK